MIIDIVKKKSKQKSVKKVGDVKSSLDNIMSPSKMGTKDERIDIKIPKKAKIYGFLNGDKTEKQGAPPIAAWRRLDKIYTIAQQNKETYAIKIFDDFISRIELFYPEKVDVLEKLRPLIIRQILHEEKLTEEYYKLLREL